jgi:hypothetical protein
MDISENLEVANDPNPFVHHIGIIRLYVAGFNEALVIFAAALFLLDQDTIIWQQLRSCLLTRTF